MARTLRQVDAWINEHVKNHVLSGHTHPAPIHGHPLPEHDHPHTHDAEPETPPPVEPPPPPATGGPRVTSIEALLNAMADDANTVVTLAAVKHTIQTAATKGARSLWIGERFARRTRPLIVQWDPGTQGVLDGGGTGYFGGTTFTEGVHDIDWRIGRYDNGNPTSTGVIVLGGYRGKAKPRNITLRGVELLPGIWSSSGPGYSHDHGIYGSYNAGSDHFIDGYRVHQHPDPAKRLDSALHFDHGEDYPSTDPNVDGLVCRNFLWEGLDQAFIQWDATTKGVVLEDGLIRGGNTAIRIRAGGPVTLRRVRSEGVAIGLVTAGPAPVYDGCRYDTATKQLVLT